MVAPALFTVAEAAEVLRTSRGTVYRLVAQRRIRHERVGLSRRGKIVIPEDAITEYRVSVTVVAEAKGSVSRLSHAPVRLKNFSVD